MKSSNEIIHTNKPDNALTTQQSLSPDTQRRIDGLKSRYPTLLHDFADTFSVNNTSRFSAYPTRCILGNAPTLTDLNLCYGDTSAIQWLIIHLAAFQEQIGVPNKMTKWELNALAQSIADGYHYLKTTEIMLFLFRLQGGLYNVDWFSRVTPDKILNTLRSQFIPYRDKIIYYTEKQAQEKREREENSRETMSYEEYKEIEMLTKMYEMKLSK